ncbi:MAG: carboxypeptidase regulatory-like domain-containing protein [Acidobacteria bacterium]|nr:carboxypeptidase regulatory-like domain-containing protein [Acidobacteriota bacterium]
MRRLILLAAATAAAYAQDVRGVILGRVLDASGAVVVNAAVRATNLNTNTIVPAATNVEGNYTIPFLLPGMYRVTVEAPGFKTATREAIELRTSERRTADFQLDVGATAETIEVKAEAPLLDQSTSNLGMTIDAKRVSELPMVGGNPFYVARITPGFNSTGGRYGANPFDYGAGSTDSTVNGTRPGANEITLDGSPNMFGRNTAFALPEDLVQEMRVETASYDAGIGHAPGATVNVSMKAGTNRLHGTGYHFDSRLRATPWHTNRFIYDPNTGPITPEKIARNTPGWLHQRWGGTAGGPLWIPNVYNGKDRTFWTFGYEGLHILRNLSFTGTMPTSEERNGDFSALLRAGSQYQIYDPATIATAPNGRFSRNPFPGNLVPASRISSIAKSVIPYWPAPNQPGSADFRSNYFNTQKINRNNQDLIGRIDHNFSDRHRAFLRISNNYRHERIQAFPSDATGDLPSQEGYGAVVDDVYTFSPSLLLNVRYGLTFQKPYTERLTTGFDLTRLGFPASLVQQLAQFNPKDRFTFPQFVVDGGAFTNLGHDSGGFSSSNYHTLGGTLTKLTGNHNVRAGGEFRLYRQGAYNFGNASPRFDFGSAYSNGPLDNSPGAPIGPGFASFLLGITTGGFVSVNASYASQTAHTGLFVHDDWKITRKLTLNLGIRYEYESPLTERFNRTVRGYDFQTPNPVEPQARLNYAANPIPEIPAANFRVTGGLLFAGAGDSPRSLWLTDRNNFAPRVGLAYQLTSKSVVRTGYGIFFDVVGTDRTGPNQSGFSQSTNLVPTLDNGLTFIATLANPFPSGIQAPPGASGGLRTFLGRSGDHFFEQRPNPYMQRWSFSIQRQLPMRTVVEIGYVGNRGTQLLAGRQLSPIPRQYLSTSPTRDQATINFLSANVANPFFGIPDFAGSGLSGRNVARNQLLRAYPQFTQVNISVPAGFSYYHALQFQIEKRFSGGLTFQAAYTYSRFMEAINYLDPTDSRLEKVVSDLDYPQRFVATAVYELPFGRGRKLGSNMNRWLNLLAGGWQVEGWYEGQSGNPLGFGNAIFRGDLKNVPLPVSERTSERWFNTATGFERNNANRLDSNIRTFPSRFSGIRGDGINNLDASFFKNFRFGERVTFQFRMESYNALNHVQFTDPTTDPYNSNFGQIFGEKGHGQRQVTFGFKAVF